MKRVLLLCGLVVLLSFSYSVRAAPRQRTALPAAPSPVGALDLAGSSVPSGYMILGDTAEAPRGYTYTGRRLVAEATAWEEATPLPQPRTELGTAVVGDLVYAIGGYENSYSGRVQVFDSASGAWVERAPLGVPRTRLEAVELGGKIYAIGGFNGGPLGTVEEYTPSADAWLPRAPLLTPRMMHSVGVIDGKIYVVGGSQDGLVSLGSVEEYDPITNVWTMKAPIPTARGRGAAVVIDRKLYVFGGSNNPLPVEVYDPVHDQWSSRSTDPGFYDIAAVQVDGRVFALGGYFGHSGTFAGVYEYQVGSDSWREAAPMRFRRQSAGAAVLGGAIHAIGGNTFSGPALASVEALGLGIPVHLHRRN